MYLIFHLQQFLVMLVTCLNNQGYLLLNVLMLLYMSLIWFTLIYRDNVHIFPYQVHLNLSFWLMMLAMSLGFISWRISLKLQKFCQISLGLSKHNLVTKLKLLYQIMTVNLPLLPTKNYFKIMVYSIKKIHPIFPNKMELERKYIQLLNIAGSILFQEKLPL